MEFFNKAEAVRLKSHLDKYLLADDDEQTVTQHRNGSPRKARWVVELVEDNPHLIRLKSCHGGYLTASDEFSHLGMTGKKVVQSFPVSKKDFSIEWEPIKEGHQVKLRTKSGGKFLRANGATPPWRNSITHDFPHRTATQDWILWDVDVLDISVLESEYLQSSDSPSSNFSSLQDDFVGSNTRSLLSASASCSPSISSQTRSPSIASEKSRNASGRQNGMEFFEKAKKVRLRSHLGKYLVADDDETTVLQNRNGSSQKARWTVEFVEGKSNVIRLKSCHGLYLTVTDTVFLLGATGKKVLQTHPAKKTDTCIEWEPIKEGFQVKLRTSEGKFLRANWGPPPYRNSVTHDVPHRTATQDWVLWEVDVLDMYALQSEHLQSCESISSSFSSSPDNFIDSNTRSLSSAAASCAPSISSETRWPSIASDRSRNSISSRKSGMEFFDKAKAVRLQNHHGKYLVADEDETTVRQSGNGSSHKARWTVEFVEGKSNVIRLKSSHGLYLTATNEKFLLGATGKKVLQTLPAKTTDTSIEWEPVKEGSYVKLRTSEGKYLRANWGPPPYRNSITHDIPHRTATQDWVLWEVHILDIAVLDTMSVSSCSSPCSSFSSLPDDYIGSPDTGSPMAFAKRNGAASVKQVGHYLEQRGMEFFRKAKSVRLKSRHDKYLLADSDQESVIQDRHGSTKQAHWSVDFVEDFDNVVRLKSCYGKYLTATEEQFLLGVTGRRVIQSSPSKLDSKVEWEPVREGFRVRLKTRYGNYLRANGGVPPWRNSITHDIPHRHQDWILWEVDTIEIRPESPEKIPPPSDSPGDDDLSSSSFQLLTPSTSMRESGGDNSSAKYEGRTIYYYVADDDGNVNDAIEGASFHFKGHGLEELTRKLEEETGLENIIVCSKNKLNGKFYPLCLGLPPNNATMTVVVVPSTSSVAGNFIPPT